MRRRHTKRAALHTALAVSVALALNAAHTCANEIRGFHIDDETCSGLVFDNATRQREVCQTYLDTLANLTATYAAASATLPRPLTLAVDAGTGWVCPQPSCSPPYCGCINITWRGQARSVADHVVDIANETVLMDYDRDPTSVYARALPYLAYADATWPPSAASSSVSPSASPAATAGGARVRVGVAISQPCSDALSASATGVGAPPAPRCNPASWQTRSEVELAALMAAAGPQLERHPSFAGWAVFHGGTWFAQWQANPAPSSTQWPANIASWYINHSMIVDKDTAGRTQWLAWAASRRMTEVYIAPHAGNAALIMIPGREGSPAAEKKFCEFIGLAAKQGLGVRISAGTPGDMRFVRNCTTSNEAL